MSAILPNPVTVNISLDATAFEAAANEFAGLVASAPEDLAERLVSLADSIEQLFCVSDDRSPALGTVKLTMCLEPSDLFLRLLAALRTGNGDAAVTEQLLDSILHEFNSVGGLEPTSEDRASAESQGSVGACPGNAQCGGA